MNPRRAPERIRPAHPSNEMNDPQDRSLGVRVSGSSSASSIETLVDANGSRYRAERHAAPLAIQTTISIPEPRKIDLRRSAAAGDGPV